MNQLEKMSITEIKAALFDCDQNIKRQQQIFNVLGERLGVLLKEEEEAARVERVEQEKITKAGNKETTKTM